jgi:hypothetical protein
VRQDGGATRFDFGGWSSEMGTRRGQDGAVTFITTAPGQQGYAFTVADQGGARRLVIQDDQHEYVFTEERQ